MINTVQQALEDVYVALGGQEDIDRLTVSQVLAKIYNVLGGTGDHGQETVPQLIDLIATVAPSGGGGGGTSFPLFTVSDDGYFCDMTYAEVYEANQADNINGQSICKVRTTLEGLPDTTVWGFTFYVPHNEEIDAVFDSIPDTVQNGFVVMKMGREQPSFYFGDNGSFYRLK